MEGGCEGSLHPLQSALVAAAVHEARRGGDRMRKCSIVILCYKFVKNFAKLGKFSQKKLQHAAPCMRQHTDPLESQPRVRYVHYTLSIFGSPKQQMFAEYSS